MVEEEDDDNDSIYGLEGIKPSLVGKESTISDSKSTIHKLTSSETDFPIINTDETPFPEPDGDSDHCSKSPPIETSLETVLSRAGAQMDDILEVIISTRSNGNEIIEKFIHLRCPPIKETRYKHLIPHKETASTPLYLFALDLHRSIKILPRLMRNILQAIHCLGPGKCILSIVEGRSTDGTTKLLQSLQIILLEKPEFSTLAFHILKNDTISPKAPKTDRVATLAFLRNLALSPLTKTTTSFSSESTIIFIINDVVICAEDILELLHQRIHQNADMMYGMDWIERGQNFYDVWIARTMNGDSFFEIPQNGGWQFASKNFWNDPNLKKTWEEGRVFQVCSVLTKFLRVSFHCLLHPKNLNERLREYTEDRLYRCFHAGTEPRYLQRSP
jgi:Cryptococcal mannosyltransferase 1